MASAVASTSQANHRTAVFTISDGTLDVEPSTSFGAMSSSEDTGLHRQVTFCVGVQTDVSQSDYANFNPLARGVNILQPTTSPGHNNTAGIESVDGNQPTTNHHYDVVAGPLTSADTTDADQLTVYGSLPFVSANTRQNENRWQRIVRNLDCTTFCYMAIAGLMIGVGILVTTVTAREKVTNDDSNGSAQLWIVGPIFISSGILVCIKAATHVCKRVNQAAPRIQDGNLLRPDTRASLRAVPPSYSKALIAPVPSFVVEVEDFLDDKIQDDGATRQNDGANQNDADTESLRLVTVTCDPLPPTYDEALEIGRRFSLSSKRMRNVRDMATQIDPSSIESIPRSLRSNRENPRNSSTNVGIQISNGANCDENREV